MDDQSNIFNPEPANTPAPPEPKAPNPYETMLKGIKNENGEQKYKTLEDALVALEHSQKYIPELKSQLSEANSELERIKSETSNHENIEDVVQRLLAKREPSADTPPVVAGLDEQAVMNLVKQSLGQSEAEKLALANMKQVHDTLVSKFGDKAKEVLTNKASELGTTVEELGNLAKANPKMVLAMFPAHVKDPAPTVGNRRTPPPTKIIEGIPMPEKSLLAGASNKARAEFMDKIKAGVYAKYGVEHN